jgi:hypothetical protein
MPGTILGNRRTTKPYLPMKPLPTLSLAAVLLLPTVASAQARTVDVKFNRQPKRDWSEHKAIVIGDFAAPDQAITDRSRDISEAVAQVMNELKDGPRIYDRNQLEKVLKDQKKQLSGNFDETTVTEIGKLIGGSGIMLTGRVQQDDFFQASSSGRIPLNRYGGGIAYNNKEGTYILSVNFTLLDLKTGETKGSFNDYVTIEAKNSGMGYIGAADINKGELQREALVRFQEKFRQWVAPYVLMETIKLKTDPGFNKRLDPAIKHFELDEVDSAVEMFRGMAEDAALKPVAQLRAKYNYGLLLLAKGDCATAMALFKSISLADGASKMDYEDYKDGYEMAKEQCAAEAKKQP